MHGDEGERGRTEATFRPHERAFIGMLLSIYYCLAG